MGRFTTNEAQDLRINKVLELEGMDNCYTKAGEEIYYFGTKTLEVNDGKYATWKWVPGSNILIKQTNDKLHDGITGFGSWYDIILVPVGTTLKVQDFEAMKPEEQVTVTNQVFKPLWDINNPTK